jgi:toxin-antitoxin system PIN domain toxin
VIALDTQLLLYAYDDRSPLHKPAAAYLSGILSGSEPVGFPLPVVHSYVRLLTNPVITGKRIPLKTALDDVDSWLALPHVRLLIPGERHWQILKDLASDAHATANLFPDAIIAAIVMEYGAVLHTNDRDFARFPGLRWQNPLQP